MFKFLQESLSITVASLRPPNRQNKKRKQRRAVERFEEDLKSLIDDELRKNYQKNFRDNKSRQSYAEKLVKTKIIEKEVENYQKTDGTPWNKFRVGNKQKVNIKTFLKRRIKFDSRI